MSITVAAGKHALETLKLAHELETSGARPTAGQAARLASWTGWGILSPAFAPSPSGSWAQIADEITGLLSPMRYREASTSLDVSFFTPAELTRTVWSLLAAAGFTGGRVLEPGCGTGAFMREAPENLDITFHGIERDSTSAAIAALTNPGAVITAKQLQDVPLSDESYDAVIGNFPFASGWVQDKAGIGSGSLHGYFMRRALKALRPGGYMAVITSSFVMDNPEGFEEFTQAGAQFVSAVRLPEEMFTDTGAQVVCDLILLRKAPEGEPGSAPSMTRKLVLSAPANSWWADHPELVAGEFERTSFYQRPLTVRSRDLAADVAAAADIVKTMIEAKPMTAGSGIPVIDATADVEGFKDGSYQVMEDRLVRITDGEAVPVARPSKKLLALVELRDRACALLDAEADTSTPDADLDPLRSSALEAYTGYVKAFGPINDGTLTEGKIDPETGVPILSWRPVNLAGFRSDPDFHLVAALEIYDQETGESGPAPILLQRINKAPVPITSAETPAEALAVSLGETGRLDLDRIASLLGAPGRTEAVAALGDLIYADPSKAGEWVPARDYLSGDVRSKLTEAISAAVRDAAYERNVTALHEVVPTDLGASEIRVSLGVPWIAVTDYQEFVTEVLGAPWARVEHSDATASWNVEGETAYAHEAVTLYGVPDLGPVKLFAMGMNNKAPVVKVYDPRSGRDIKDAAATSAAQEKLEAIRSAFSVWIWEDAQRTERITAEYNRRFRSHVARVSDGSYLRFPTMSTGITPHWWQLNIVDRIISSEAVLCGHTVGAGKTLSMAMAAVALRMFGLANKPAIVVPNHLLEQISREMSQAFPLGKFLIATKDDLTKERRRAFAARCSTGDWDAVVMTHNAFTSLPVHPSVEKAWIREQSDDLRASMYGADNGYSFSARQVSKKLRAFEGKLEKMRTDARTDDGQVYFEQLGVDYIAVDEAHYMKRLDVGSRMEGFSMGASKRATDLLLKTSWLRSRRGGKPVLGLFTGTPLTNSLVEIFVWQTFLQPEVLAAAGLSDFNAWASNFVHFRSVVEISPEGGSYRTKTRPVSILNAPELYAMFSLNADLLSADDINLERPAAELHQTAVQQAPLQREFTDHLVVRAEALRNGGGVTDNDNMLAIVGDGRRSALDPQLVGLDENSPKLDAVAAEIVRIHEAGKDTVYGDSAVPGALQVAFCDQGTPSASAGAQSYGRLRAKLIDGGIPAGRIRWIHEATDDKSRAALFSACRSGAVSVLLGSTEKLGTGTNIQTRLAAIHHVDAPWRPSDIEQRDGRALRPKNLNPVVELHRYVVEGTFDAYQWQLLETKAISFAAMTSSKGPGARELADISEVAPSYTQMKALAAGDPRLLRQAEVSDLISRLNNLRAMDRQSVTAARKSIPTLRKRADFCEWEAKHITDALRVIRTPTASELGVLSGILPWVRTTMATALPAYASREIKKQYRCGTVTVETTIDLDMPSLVKVTVLAGYRTLASTELGKHRFRTDPEKAAKLVMDTVVDLIEALPESAAKSLEEAADCRSRADAAQKMVEGYRFSRQDELDAAVAELESITREMEYAAAEQENMATAAA